MIEVIERHGTGPAVRPGHWRSLELLEKTDAVLRTLSLYEGANGHPGSLPPTETGLTAISPSDILRSR